MVKVYKIFFIIGNAVMNEQSFIELWILFIYEYYNLKKNLHLKHE